MYEWTVTEAGEAEKNGFCKEMFFSTFLFIILIKITEILFFKK